MLVLVTGGARSGKSSYAEGILHQIEGQKLYIATAIAFDEEMKERIKKHQSVRPAGWETYEGFKNLDEIIKEKGIKVQGVLLDCVTLWLTNLLFDAVGATDIDLVSQDEMNQIEQDILGELQKFIREAQRIDTTVVLVTNEIGMGIVPENKLSRAFRDLQGRMNQMLGKAADQVVLVVCGVPLVIKQ